MRCMLVLALLLSLVWTASAAQDEQLVRLGKNEESAALYLVASASAYDTKTDKLWISFREELRPDFVRREMVRAARENLDLSGLSTRYTVMAVDLEKRHYCEMIVAYVDDRGREIYEYRRPREEIQWKSYPERSAIERAVEMLGFGDSGAG